MAKRILIGGGSGFIGRNLDRFLTSLGHEVTLISRKPAPRSITWSDVESSGIPEADAVVQLSGAPILDAPWTEARQKELLSSRVDLTKLLVEAISKSRSPPKVFIAGSAVGIYPSTIGRQFNEESKEVANNFPGKLVQRWEESAALPASIKNITRLVHMRTGVVLAPEGGALEKMAMPFKLFVGGPIASGKQRIPWIHIKDMVRLHLHAIENTRLTGPLNAVSPNDVSQREFATALGKILHKPSFMPLPSFAVSVMFGSRGVLLAEGSKIVPKRTLESGFKFEFPTLDEALTDIYRKKN